MHILTTLWSTSYAATLIDGCLVREKLYIRWINYVLGTQYTNQRATQLWEIGKLLQLDNAYWVRCNPDLGHLLEDYPPECADRDQTLAYLAAYHFDELCSILPSLTDEDWEELKQSKMLTIQAIYNAIAGIWAEEREAGEILLRVKEDGENAELSVSDNGVGIADLGAALTISECSGLTPYNEHGCGLKSALSYLCGGDGQWSIESRTAEDAVRNRYRCVMSPYLAIDGAMHAGFYEGQGSIGHETGTSVRIR